MAVERNLVSLLTASRLYAAPRCSQEEGLKRRKLVRDDSALVARAALARLELRGQELSALRITKRRTLSVSSLLGY